MTQSDKEPITFQTQCKPFTTRASMCNVCFAETATKYLTGILLSNYASMCGNCEIKLGNTVISLLLTTGCFIWKNVP